MWEKRSIEEDKIYHGKLGDTGFWVRKNGKEWKIASENTRGHPEEIDFSSIEEDPGDIKWSSYIADKNNILNFRPALPDRPVVLKPKSMFHLLPGMHTQLYFYIPVWIQFFSGNYKKENLITELPSTELSSTWFGDPDIGVLAYSLHRDVNTNLIKTGHLRHETLCSVKIMNNSSTILNIQRLLLNVEFLGIYGEGSHLFTSEIKVTFKGENTVSDIDYSPHAPAFLEKPKQLTTPRNPETKNVLRKSFHFIKSLTEY